MTQGKIGWRAYVNPQFTPEDPGTPNTIDQDSTNFIIAAGISDSVQISAIETLVSDLKAYGLWTKMKAIYPFVGGSAASHKWNLKDPRDLNVAFRLTFNGGGIHNATGYQPNGTNGSANTFLSPSANQSLTSAHFSLYSRTSDKSLSIYGSHGIYNSSSNCSYMIIRRNLDNYVGGAMWSESNGGGAFILSSTPDGRGLYMISRTSNNSLNFYKNRTSIISNTLTQSSTLPTNSYWLGGNNGSAYGDYDNKELAFASLGDGLTDTEAANFYTSVQKFQTTLGRHVGTPYVSDPDAVAFLIAAGITDGTQAAAINTLVIRMKADGVWTKMKAIYPFVGGTAFSHKFNLKDPRDLDAAYRLVFNGGGTHTSNGYKGNGSNSYADSKFPANILSPGNAHLSFYNRTTALGSGYVTAIQDNSSWDANKTVLLGVGNSGNGGVIGGYFAGAGVNSTTTKTTAWTSLTLVTTTSTNLQKVYNSGIVQGTSTTNSTNTFSTSNLVIGAHAGAFNYVGAYETSFVSFGDGLTDTDATNLYSAVQAYQTTLGRQVNVPIVSDTDAQAFLNAANITSFQQATAVNKLVVDLKAAGVWSKMKAIYPFVGGSAASHKFNLKDPRDLDAAFRLVFSGGGTHTSTGYLGNGSNSYARTYITHNTLSQNNTHVSFYNRYNSTSNYNNFIGCIDYPGTSNGIGIYPTNQNNFYMLVNSIEILVNIGHTSVNKFWMINRNSSTQEKVFINGSLSATINKNSQTGTSKEIYLGSINGYGNAGINESSFASIGDGLTDAESTALYTAVQTYQTSLGRSVDTPVYNNGLVLNLDAGNANSYPGTGTTWFDLASGNNGTLVNGPTYDTTNGGSILFDGVNDYVGLGNTPIFGTGSFTIDMWIYLPISDYNYRSILSKRSNSNYTGFAVYRPPYSNSVAIQLASNSSGPYFTTSISSTANSWNHISIVVDRTLKTVVLYSNGIKNTTTLDITNLGDMTNNGVNLNLGLEAGIPNWNNKISTTKIYSRALSETEVLNNFNSTRGRFGL